MESLPPPAFQRNDRRARQLIWVFSFVIFAAVSAMGAVHFEVHWGFNLHIFAKVNAIINSMVSLLLAAALVAVKLKKYLLHKRLMLAAIILSAIFLVSYVMHHLFTKTTVYGGRGAIRYFYLSILSTHIFLAAIIMPFVLFTAYRALIGDFARHRKLARITWPIWFYVSLSGVLVYLMISPYYS